MNQSEAAAPIDKSEAAVPIDKSEAAAPIDNEWKHIFSHFSKKVFVFDSWVAMTTLVHT